MEKKPVTKSGELVVLTPSASNNPGGGSKKENVMGMFRHTHYLHSCPTPYPKQYPAV